MPSLQLPFLAGHTAPIRDLTITLSGPFTSFSVFAPSTGDTLTYTKPVSAGQSVIINCATGAMSGTGGHLPDPSKLVYTGADLLTLLPTSVTPRVDYTADGGTIRVDGAPKYT